MDIIVGRDINRACAMIVHLRGSIHKYRGAGLPSRVVSHSKSIKTSGQMKSI